MCHRILCAFGLVLSIAICDEGQPRLDVPFEPTHPEVVDAMLKLAGVTAEDVVCDLGCGDGRIVVAAAKDFGARSFGIDIDPQRLKEAIENAQQAGVADRATFRRGDLKAADLTGVSVVTLYLLESVNRLIRPKLLSELEPGTRVVSHAFTMGEWKCDKKEDQPKARSSTIYYWVIPAAAGGTWTWTDGEAKHSLRLEQSFQSLSGRLTSPTLGKQSIKDCSLSGRDLVVSLTAGKEKESVKATFRGVVKGDVIEGTQQWEGGPDALTRPWRAVRAPVDLAGDWRLTVGSQKLNLNGTLRFVRAGSSWKAQYSGEKSSKEIEPSALYVWGSSVRFELPVEEETFTFTGFFQGNGASGKVSDGEASRGLTWKARRIAPKGKREKIR